MRTALLLVLVGLMIPASAAAQDAPAEDPEARSLELFEESVAFYQQGRFAEAAALLRTAYEMHEEPVLLYNLGRALEGDGDYPGAIEAYERYLETVGEIPDRGAIERKVATLRETLAERARLGRIDEVSDAQPERAPPPDEAGGPSAAPWIVAGVGAVGVGVGAVLGVMARSAHDDAVNAPSQEATRDEQDRAEGLALGATVAFVVGGLVMAGGVVWGVLDLSSGDQSTRVSIGPGAVSVQGSF